MKRRISALILVFVPAPGLNVSWDAVSSTASLAQPKEYPYMDDAGYWHYQVRVNGEVLPMEHDALLSTAESSKYNEMIYPLTDILDYYGVAYNLEADNDFSTVIGTVRTSFNAADSTFMWSCNATLTKIKAYDETAYVDITLGSGKVWGAGRYVCVVCAGDGIV